MESEDDGFPKQGGEALEIGDDFDSEEEPDDQESDTQQRQNMQIQKNLLLNHALKRVKTTRLICRQKSKNVNCVGRHLQVRICLIAMLLKPTRNMRKFSDAQNATTVPTVWKG